MKHVQKSLTFAGFTTLMFFVGSASAATLDCSDQTSPTVAVVCQRTDLQDLTRAEDQALNDRRNRHPDDPVSSPRTEAIFIGDVRACGSDPECTESKIKQRLSVLTDTGQSDTPPQQELTTTQAVPPREGMAQPTPPPFHPPVSRSYAVRPIQNNPPPVQPTASSSSGGQSVVFSLLAAFVMVPIVLSISSQQRSARARKLFWQIAETHRDALGQRFLQLVSVDAYGKRDFTRWRKEEKIFVERTVVPALRAAGVKPKLVATTTNSLLPSLEKFAEARAQEWTAGLAFNTKMTPIEFEAYCAELLRRSGWEVELTKASGDQGADVVARRNGRTLVVQCKLYTSPVGNKAVQEAHGAKSHLRAQYAAVVTNTTFTPSAQELARSTSTLLLHHTELSGLTI